MSNSKKDFDEMQKQRRDKIGRQMFLTMSWTVFLSIGFYVHHGIHWLKPPMDIAVIALACVVIYHIRLIAAKAIVPPGARNKKSDFIWLVVISVVAFVMLGSLLTAVFALTMGLFHMLMTAVMNKKDNEDDEEQTDG